MFQHVGASSRKLALRDQDLDRGVVDLLFGEVARDTGEENFYMVEKNTPVSKGITNKSNSDKTN